MIFYPFIVSFLSGLFLNVFFIFLSRKNVFLLNRLKDKKNGIPKSGGLGIVFSFFIVVFFATKMNPVFLVFALVFLLGILDDIFCFSPAKKFIAQIVISLIAVNFGIGTHIVFLPAFVNIVISVLWFTAIMNAFNFLDILDGLAGGMSVITALTFALVSGLTGNGVVLVMALVLLGSNLSFLLFNFPKAKLYMGDTGSLFNGIVFAVMAVLVSYAPSGREIALATPLLILALPVYDLLFVMVMRLLSGKPLAQKSLDHFVLRLIRHGITPLKAVLLMVIFNVLFSLGAIFLLVSSRSFLTGICLLSVALVAWLCTAYKLSKVNVEEKR